jgi:Fe-S oxidoreductase
MNEKIEIPIDVPNAEYLFICPTTGNTRFPDYAIKIPQLLNAAGVDYTVSPMIVDTGTEIDHIVAHHELSKRMLMEIEDEAERLGARTFLISECGCDVRTFLVEAGQHLGRDFKLPVRSLDSLLLEVIRTGRLPVRKIENSVTLHDPCYVTRLSGLGETIRELLREVAAHFMEMSPSREFNYCCNGGSGPFRLPENAELRRRASRFKVNQIIASKAEWVITPCAVCMLTLDDICRYYQLSPGPGRMVYMLFEIVYQAASAALTVRQERHRLQTPNRFKEQPPEFIRRHGFAGFLSDLAAHPQIGRYLQWLENDSIVQRYLQDHPEAAGLLPEWKRNAEPLKGGPVCRSRNS